MSQPSQEPDTAPTFADESLDPSPAPAKQKEMSRLERLKQKIRKLGGKDPDIYPMF